MRRPDLKRVLRNGKRAIESLAAAASSPVRVEDGAGNVVFGEASASGERHPIVVSGEAVGAVVGSPLAAQIAQVLEHLMDREAEKLALADETLGRYKELTLLYDIGDKLARVLDEGEVARLVVDEAARFLKASRATLLIADRRRGILDPIASTDPSPFVHLLDGASGVEGRVVETGRAEFVEDVSASEKNDVEPGVCAIMCAPLRSGENVFGILRVTSNELGAWNAGHLKLVSSLAGNAGAAVSHARLHGERLRQQSLRHQISRFASPVLIDAAFQGRSPPVDQPVAALFCDVGEIARFADRQLEPDALLGIVRHATAVALEALMAEGAVVQISDDEILVGLFAAADLSAAASAAVRAARNIGRALDARFEGIAPRPGVAVTHAVLPESRAAEAFFLAVGQAANLQRRAEGRILVDARVSAALGEPLAAIEDLTAPAGAEGATVYEVPA